MEHPPPVPVTQPSVQNLAHSEGIRFAGWSGLSDTTRLSWLPSALTLSAATAASGGGWAICLTWPGPCQWQRMGRLVSKGWELGDGRSPDRLEVARWLQERKKKSWTESAVLRMNRKIEYMRPDWDWAFYEYNGAAIQYLQIPVTLYEAKSRVESNGN